jgi:hypothetical protein
MLPEGRGCSPWAATATHTERRKMSTLLQRCSNIRHRSNAQRVDTPVNWLLSFQTFFIEFGVFPKLLKIMEIRKIS